MYAVSYATIRKIAETDEKMMLRAEKMYEAAKVNLKQMIVSLYEEVLDYKDRIVALDLQIDVYFKDTAAVAALGVKNQNGKGGLMHRTLDACYECLIKSTTKLANDVQEHMLKGSEELS